ncbi:MAG: WecB/TagA/CpsF family glycosyltransferase, partial [Desulfobacterales bacterium]
AVIKTSNISGPSFAAYSFPPVTGRGMNIQQSFKIEKGSLNTFINPFSFLVLERDVPPELLEQFYIYVDGESLAALSRILGRNKTRRFSFDDTSVAPLVFNYAAENGLEIGLIGSTEMNIPVAADLIKTRHHFRQVHFHHGYYRNEEEDDILSKFTGVDIVIFAMGTPKQELALAKLRSLGWSGTGFTCGGFLDQLVESGGAPYYPEFIDKLNLRWAYRIFKEPRRLWRRYCLEYPKGIAMFIWMALSGRIKFVQ